MIQYTTAYEVNNRLFDHPFDRDLDPKNRWVILRDLLPWDQMAKILMRAMSNQGRPSVDLRYVLGALVIQSIENETDEGLILRIQENIYMQYFIGLPCFSTRPIFVPELLVTIRKRLGESGAKALSDLIAQHANQCLESSAHQPTQEDDTPNPAKDPTAPPTHRGTLKLDATVAPANIKYPTDVDLLNQARKITEGLIDDFWERGLFAQKTKPRTYRKTINKQVLSVLKSKKPSKKKLRSAKRILLESLRRNLNTLNRVLDQHPDALSLCSKKQYSDYLVVQQLYAQQKQMFDQHSHQVQDRIVSIHQPWVRPIVRGKAGKPVEFGAQVNTAEVQGYVYFDHIDFNKYNEANDLRQMVENYRKRYGYWPQAVLVDQIYLNRENRAWLKEQGIAHYGKPLGRPPQISGKEKHERQKKQNKRSEIEGKFGQAKMSFGMGRVRTKNYRSSLAKIGLMAFGLNIWRMLQDVINSPLFAYFFAFFKGLLKPLFTASPQTGKTQKLTSLDSYIPKLFFNLPPKILFLSFRL